MATPYGVQLLGALVAKWGAAIRDEIRRTPLHHIRLGVTQPDTIPETTIKKPTDAENGKRIFGGRIKLVGENLHIPEGHTPWDFAAPSREYAKHLHTFSWVRDLIALGDDGTERADAWVDAWIDEFGDWNTFSFAPDIMAPRLANWLEHADTLLRTDKSKLSFARQVRHTSLCLNDIRGPARLYAACVMALGVAYCEPNTSRLKSALRKLDRALKASINQDGIPIDRNPDTLIDVLIILLTLKKALNHLDIDPTDQMTRTLSTMGPALQFFQNASGSTFSFQGNNTAPPSFVEGLLAQTNAPKSTFSMAPHSGYHRAGTLENGVLMLDSGQCPPGAWSTKSHASALALEYSYKGHPIFINCGHGYDGEWAEASRMTAAHSALMVSDVPQSKLVKPGWQRRLLGSRLINTPKQTFIRREEDGAETWLEGTHDSYSKNLGFTHSRRLYLSATGSDLRGEDTIMWDKHTGQLQILIRFHLPTTVTATMARDARSVMLLDGAGRGWRFRADARDVAIEKSVTFDFSGKPHTTEQIVLRNQARATAAASDPDNCVRWALQLTSEPTR